MLTELTTHIAARLKIEEAVARKVLGIILNAADRQGTSFSEALFGKVPGARTLSATTGAELGGSTGTIARLIERTPGGRRHVSMEMIQNLHALGLGHEEIGVALPAISEFAAETLGLTGFGHLGDLLGKDMDTAAATEAVAA